MADGDGSGSFTVEDLVLDMLSLGGGSIKFYMPLVFRRLRKIAKLDCWLRHVCLSVLMEKLGSHQSVMKFDICVFPKICLENSGFFKT